MKLKDILIVFYSHSTEYFPSNKRLSLIQDSLLNKYALFKVIIAFYTKAAMKFADTDLSEGCI